MSGAQGRGREARFAQDSSELQSVASALQPDPWQHYADTHKGGDTVSVTKLVPFGASIQVEEGIKGLVHLSELADHDVEYPQEVLAVGGQVRVAILDVNCRRRRISLSFKRAAGPCWPSHGRARS
ncbi:S1 RNA-binding domain-containing protein [Streptomyces sp. NPDC002666]